MTLPMRADDFSAKHQLLEVTRQKHPHVLLLLAVRRGLLQLPVAALLRIRHGVFPRQLGAHPLHVRRGHLRAGSGHGLRGADGESLLHTQVGVQHDSSPSLSEHHESNMAKNVGKKCYCMKHT